MRSPHSHHSPKVLEEIVFGFSTLLDRPRRSSCYVVMIAYLSSLRTNGSSVSTGRVSFTPLEHALSGGCRRLIPTKNSSLGHLQSRHKKATVTVKAPYGSSKPKKGKPNVNGKSCTIGSVTQKHSVSKVYEGHIP